MYLFCQCAMFDVTDVWETTDQRRRTHSAKLQSAETSLKSPAGQGKKKIFRPDRSQSPVSIMQLCN